MSTPTRFKNGISTVGISNGTTFNYPLPTHYPVFTDFHDFDAYAAGDWTVTNTTSHATIGLIAGAGGILSLAGGAGSVANDIAAVIKNPLDFNFSTTQQVWFETILTADVAANNAIIAGITSANATAAVTDGIYFSKAAASASVSFVVAKSSTATTQTAVATMADATAIKLGFYYNQAENEIQVFVNGNMVYRQTTMTNLPSGVALAPGIAMKLAATAPTTAYLNADLIFAAQDLTR